VAGFRVPSDRTFSENEVAWIAFLRLASRESDPAPTLTLVQAIRLVFEHEGREI
jgi:hypothetical protein